MSKQIPDVIFDIDDVVLNWMDGFKNWLADENGIIMTIPPQGLRYSAIEECFHGQSRTEIFALIKDFSTSPSFAHLQPYPGTKEFLDSVANAGINIHALSACGTGITADLRRDGLSEYLGWKTDWPFHALPLGASKFDALKEGFDPNLGVMIDDHFGHVVSARKAGLNAIWHRSNSHIMFCPEEDKSFSETPTNSWQECGQKLVGIVQAISPETAHTLALNLSARPDMTMKQSLRTSATAVMPAPSGPF